MDREDLSKPPGDSELVRRVVADALTHSPSGAIISITKILADVMRQLPASVDVDTVIAEIVSLASVLGRVVDFDGTRPV